MTIQRRFAPISGRFEPERVAGFAGISIKARISDMSLSLGLFEAIIFPFRLIGRPGKGHVNPVLLSLSLGPTSSH